MIGALLKLIHEPVYEHRLDVLSDLITEQLDEGDRVLDIGCGGGMLGHRILNHRACPNGVRVEGVEKCKRGDEPIEVTAYDGDRMPFDDGSFDVVILADVLHHEEDELRLLRDAFRIARRFVIIKDHKPEGLLAHPRICFLDWAANNPYGVKCLYRYHTRLEWADMFSEVGVSVVAEEETIDLYPPFFNLVFGRRLQYFAVLAKASRAGLSA
jgi:ubiquinone/menaquinone biosynthesis C-methylase UbiE